MAASQGLSGATGWDHGTLESRVPLLQVRGVGKKRRSNKRRPAAGQKQPAVLGSGLRLSSYKITYDALDDGKQLPEEVANEREELHALIHRDAGAAVRRLEQLKKSYPDVPLLYNWLSAAYTAIGDHDAAKRVAVENYERNPDYLFARLNYAEICLQEGRAREVPRIFDHTFDLKMLYPDRKEFHISEVVGFMGIMGLYFQRTGEEEIARRYSDILNQLAPDHPLAIRLVRALMLARLKKLLPFGR